MSRAINYPAAKGSLGNPADIQKFLDQYNNSTTGNMGEVNSSGMNATSSPMVNNQAIPAPMVPMQSQGQQPMSFDNWGMTQETYGQLRDFIRSEEDVKGFPYLDHLGKPTVCEGNLITGKPTSYPWSMGKGGPLASEAQINAEWQKLVAKISAQANGANLRANQYAGVTDLRLTDEQCEQITRDAVLSRWQDLRNRFPNFDRFSPEMQVALFDAHYQANVLNAQKWPKLHQAARNLDQDAFCRNIRRESDPRYQQRNDAGEDLCRQGYIKY